MTGAFPLIEHLMDLPTQAHLKTIRELLTYRLGDLRADVRAAERERTAEAADGDQGVGDRKDEASRRQRVAMSGRQEERDLQELEQVEAALRRLDAGSYGDCSSCGEPVKLDRLMVQPAAERCAACQARIEAHAPRSLVT
jgi:DnaK suppressor protein